MSRPPTGPPTRRPRFWVRPIRELAATSCAGSTRLGTWACLAGSMHASRADWTATTAYTTGSPLRPCTNSNGRRARAWTGSRTLMSLTRSNRSASQPPAGDRAIPGSKPNRNVTAVLPVDPVVSKTKTGMAMSSNQSPKSETKPPSHNRWNRGCRSGEPGRRTAGSAGGAGAVTSAPAGASRPTPDTSSSGKAVNSPPTTTASAGASARVAARKGRTRASTCSERACSSPGLMRSAKCQTVAASTHSGAACERRFRNSWSLRWWSWIEVSSTVSEAAPPSVEKPVSRVRQGRSRPSVDCTARRVRPVRGPAGGSCSWTRCRRPLGHRLTRWPGPNSSDGSSRRDGPDGRALPARPDR